LLVKHFGLIDDIILEIRIRRIWRPNTYGKIDPSYGSIGFAESKKAKEQRARNSRK
jgi:hypothetical protein